MIVYHKQVQDAQQGCCKAEMLCCAVIGGNQEKVNQHNALQ